MTRPPQLFVRNHRHATLLSLDANECAARRGKEQWMAMADRKGLGVVGCIFGGVTAAVMLIACAIVLDGADGSLAHDSFQHDRATASVATWR